MSTPARTTASLAENGSSPNKNAAFIGSILHISLHFSYELGRMLPRLRLTTSFRQDALHSPRCAAVKEQTHRPLLSHGSACPIDSLTPQINCQRSRIGSFVAPTAHVLRKPTVNPGAVACPKPWYWPRRVRSLSRKRETPRHRPVCARGSNSN